MDSILSERARVRDASHRFTQALELLSLPGQNERLAGIYALDGLAGEAVDAQMHGAITEVLSAFVRRRARYDLGFTPIERTSIEVQAALTALGRKPQQLSNQDRPLDLHGIALREAYLPLCHFENAFLYDCDFEGALLVGAHLKGAWLARCNLTRANLDGADLRGADLTGVKGLIPAHLTDVQWDNDTRWP
ncbi:hypothetical protein EON80_09510 [bacterium]|nr:MAG: hypothetical protein EON80_09510 [bacterium]